MDKQYRYTLRKTTLGLASVAIAAFLAGQAPAASAADSDNTQLTDKTVEPEAPVEEKPQVGEEVQAVAYGAEAPTAEPKAAKQPTEPNYGEDEKKIKDYNESERYKQTDLQPGNPNQTQYKTDEKKAKDGFKFEFKNPSEDSPSKTEYGYQITIDKKTGQRTYTSITVTDGGKVPVPAGEKPMMSQGEKLTPGSPDVTYKPNENTGITASRSQRNLNYEASEETLKHINNKDNDSTSLGFKDNYTQDNPGVKFFGDSFALGYKVNPWPNENDKLEQLKLNGQYNEKVFVQGQEIDTGIKVDNIDESAKERLVGQVYNPITGKVVPGASAYIKNGTIHIQMPEGALKKDKSGKTVINDDSIFNTPDYKALQNLDVKFFARPRTAEEFKKIAETPDELGYTGTYTGSEAGAADINHKGNNVKIDKQGIDRYDHYNLIGGFKLNLDDTRYYDQRFEDGNGDDTSKVTSSAVKPGEPFKVGIVKPENPSDTDKSAKEMNEAESKGEASGKLIMDFINRENKGKAPEDQWKVDVDPNDIANFTITPPKSAKAGDFVAIPLEYTYTNGSKDVHWFHFVVQESQYIKPEYDTQVNFPVNEQTSPATVTEDGKRITPDHYTLPDTLETDESGNKLATDDKGNKWTVKVDGKTGQVTAKPVDPTAFNGGEKLTVPVIAHYVDEQKPGEDITEEVNAYFVIEEKANMTPRYNAKAGKAGDVLTSDVILNEEDKFNRRPTKFTLDSNTYTDDKGNTWNVSIDENTGTVTATVPNAEDGKSINGALLNVPVTAHYFVDEEEVAIKEAEVQFVAYGSNGKFETKETKAIEFDTEYKVDNLLAPGTVEVEQDGSLGEEEITVTHTIVNGEVTKSEEGQPVQTKAPVKRIVKVGPAKTDGTHTYTSKKPFEVEVRVNPELKKGEHKVVQKGVEGEEEYTITIENSKVTNTSDPIETKAPVKEIIEVGDGNFIGTVEYVDKDPIPFETEVTVDPSLKPGEIVEDQKGELGEQEVKTTINIENGQAVDETRGEPTQTKAPVNRKIRIGSKSEGNHSFEEKVEVPFEVEIEFDDSLAPGEQKVSQEGVPGEKTRTTTLTIENGKITKTEEGEFTETKAPVKQIIKVGRNTDGTHTYTSKKPFEVEVRVNPELKKGEHKVVQKGVEGEEEYTITIENSKVTNTSEPKETKAPVNEIIEVGSEDFTGTLETKKTKAIEFETEYVVDNSMEPGTTKVEQEGELGEEEITVTHTIVNGEVTKSEEGQPVQTKAPVKRIVKVGPAKTDGTHTYTSKKPFEVEVRVNPELKKGEHKVVQKGVEGEEEYTITIENSKVTNTSEPKETKAPVNEIIEVGSEDFTGTHEIVEKKEIPFETRYEYDDSLEPGEEKVVTPGSPGEQERTNTLVIKDGKVIETKEGEFKTNKEPQERLIKIGRKSSEGETVQTIEREIPYEIKVIYDENLEAGFQKIENEGKPGKEEVTITQKVKDSKPVGDPTEITKTITEKEDRVVRIGVKPVVKEVELGNNTEYRHNPELKAGEEKVIEEGSKGTVKYTTTFNKETGKLEVKEERTESKNKVVEYGSKTDGEFTYESENAFDIKVIEDPNLEAGKVIVDQEGIVGKTKTTVKIENSKEVDRTTETLVEKQDKIVRVGTKNVCPIPPLDPETPGKEDPKDPETPGEEDPKDPETPGKEDPKDPETPGEEDPKDPETPGEEDPKDPETPGEEDPKDPETPGKEDPKDPETPGKEDPKDPETPGEEDPKDPETPDTLSTESATQVDKAGALPETGEERAAHIFGAAVLSILSGLGLVATKGRKEEE
ncbi:peptidase [Dolosicoccus paucivorans]|uniref:Peptidase n=2 Tax=Dolosicoccus paucivorans TaxID=84521 RepID=A0A2N6SLC7_9LACT|nr:G5 domain-containing protein [Dolosicoccus paucivorans]PMC57846.1 peptidase [Dolosicoccus paucivorans]